MDLSYLLGPGNVVPTLKATTKKQVFAEMAARAARVTKLDERQIFDVVTERERLGTTGIGGGIAIPHGKIADLDRLYGFFARFETPVDFDAIDGEPVDLVFMLLAPEGAGADHLKALAKVSRVLRDRAMCEKLRGSRNADALYALLTESATPHAA
ncbi:MAG: PTS IIA-like nitrogen regulatory protein PtsN [Alphaproteobacteria bacterium]|nr:PTS IIA-like nitrogen regulatory protein PtsN [Alphaproteobacteria bacterium]